MFIRVLWGKACLRVFPLYSLCFFLFLFGFSAPASSFAEGDDRSTSSYGIGSANSIVITEDSGVTTVVIPAGNRFSVTAGGGGPFATGFAARSLHQGEAISSGKFDSPSVVKNSIELFSMGQKPLGVITSVKEQIYFASAHVLNLMNKKSLIDSFGNKGLDINQFDFYQAHKVGAPLDVVLIIPKSIPISDLLDLLSPFFPVVEVGHEYTSFQMGTISHESVIQLSQGIISQRQGSYEWYLLPNTLEKEFSSPRSSGSLVYTRSLQGPWLPSGLIECLLKNETGSPSVLVNHLAWIIESSTWSVKELPEDLHHKLNFEYLPRKNCTPIGPEGEGGGGEGQGGNGEYNDDGRGAGGADNDRG